MAITYTWGSTELKALRNSYIPFIASGNGVNVIEVLPSADKTEFTSALQQTNRGRKVGKFEGITDSWALIRSLESDFMAATKRIFVDKLGESTPCIIVGFNVKTTDWTGRYQYTLDLLECEPDEV